MSLWKISQRELRSHRMRTLLTATSIIVGVAAVVAVRLAVASVRESFGEMQTAVGGDTGFDVAAPDGGLFPQPLTDELGKAPGVEQATPIYERLTVMYAGDERAKVLVWGVDPARDATLLDYELISGQLLGEREDGVLLDEGYARGLNVTLNDEVRLLTNRGRLKATVVGLVRARTGAALAHGSSAFLPLATLQRQYRAVDRVNRIHLTLAAGANADATRAEVARRLPTGVAIRTAGVQTQKAEETLQFFRNSLRMASNFVLLAAVFIVANTFFMTVAQRRRQIAVLRAIGATRGQIRVLVLREALFLATLATSFGVLIGWGGAIVLAGALGQLFGTNLPRPELTPLTLGLAALFGVGVSLLGALLPARKAAGVEPIEGMHEVSHADKEGLPRWALALGAISVPVAAALLGAHFAGRLPRYDAIKGAIGLLIATAPLFGLAAPPASRVVVLLLRVWIGAEARLARKQLLARQVRTVLTLGVLFVVSSTGVGLACTVLDRIADIQNWYRRAMQGEFFLRAMTPDLASWQFVEAPEEAEARVRRIPGIANMYTVRFVNGEAAGQSVMIVAREYETEDTVGVEADAVEPRVMLRKFNAGEVTIGSVLAQRAGLAAGDEIEVQSGRGPQRFHIAAIENDYMAGGLTIHIERRIAAERLDIHGADVFIVTAQPEHRAAVQAALEQIAADYGLLFQSYGDLVALVDKMQSGVVAGLWMVIVLGFLVATLGVTNTLSMNVWEQTRELAMLRVVAMTRGQARRTVIAEAAILGAVGLAPGVAAGLGLAWIMNRSLVQLAGHPVEFHLRPELAVLGFVVALILVLLSAWLPAHRAMQVDPAQALRYE